MPRMGYMPETLRAWPQGNTSRPFAPMGHEYPDGA
jgi:hypothetical protein